MDKKRKMDDKRCCLNCGESVKAADVRRSYERISIIPIISEPENSMLTSSIVETTMIESVGQELGPAFDFSSTGGVDTNTSKTFNTEWE